MMTIIISTEIDAKAAKLWETFDHNERLAVRFGIFPASKMDPTVDNRTLCVALMRIANGI